MHRYIIIKVVYGDFLGSFSYGILQQADLFAGLVAAGTWQFTATEDGMFCSADVSTVLDNPPQTLLFEVQEHSGGWGRGTGL